MEMLLPGLVFSHLPPFFAKQEMCRHFRGSSSKEASGKTVTVYFYSFFFLNHRALRINDSLKIDIEI